MILLIGTDDALVEGLAQSLAATGQKIVSAQSMAEAVDLVRRDPPLLVVADRANFFSADGGWVERLPLARGGAIVTYRVQDDRSVTPPAPASVARLMLADLELPLERNRLLALTQHVISRARDVGRSPRGTLPESPAM